MSCKYGRRLLWRLLCLPAWIVSRDARLHERCMKRKGAYLVLLSDTLSCDHAAVLCETTYEHTSALVWFFAKVGDAVLGVRLCLIVPLFHEVCW